MSVNTAVSFALCGVALLLGTSAESAAFARGTSAGCAAAALILALVNLAEDTGVLHTHVDQWLFAAQPGALPNDFPGTTSPATASGFALLATALISHHFRGPRVALATHLVASAALAVALLGLLAYMFDADALIRFLFYSTMAVHTAVLMVVMSLGILFARPAEGITAEFLSSRFGGSWARRILPIAIALTLGVAWLRHHGESSGWYQTEIGIGIITAFTITALGLLLWLAAAHLNRFHSRTESLTRLYRVLSEVNRTIVAAKESSQLFKDICKVSVDVGDFPTAWIGILDRAESRILPITFAGQGEEHFMANFHAIDLRLSPDDPIGTALGAGTASVVHGLNRLHAPPPLRRLALHLASPSAAIVPFCDTHQLHGILCLHAGPDTQFGPEWMDLLSKLAADISFALSHIALESLVSEARSTRAYLAAIVDSTTDAVIAKDLAGIVTAWNAAAEQLFGYAKSAVVGQSIRQIIPQDRWPEEDSILNRIRRGERVQRLQTVRLHRKGHAIHVSVTISPIIGPDGVILGASSIVRDVTDLRRAEEKREEAFRQLTQLKGAVDEHAIVAITDVRGRITFANDKFCQISGYTRDELVGQDHRLVNSGHHPRDFMRDLWRTIARGSVWHGEIKNRRKDGSCYWVETTLVPFLADGTHERHYLALRTDITSLKDAESALRASDERFQLALAGTEAGLWDWNPVSDAAFFSPRLKELLGYTPASGDFPNRGTEFQQWIHSNDRESVMTGLDSHLKHGSPYDAEFRLRTKSGEYLWVESRGQALRDSSGVPYRMVGWIISIEKRKQVDNTLRAYQEQLRQLAGRLIQVREDERTHLSREVHDGLGQLLTSLKMDLRWIQRRVEPTPSHETLQAIRQRLAGAMDLFDDCIRRTQDLSFALRPGSLDTLGLADAIREEVRHFEARTGVRFELRLPSDAPRPNPAIDTPLFRMFQEILSNIARHSSAQNVIVELKLNSDDVLLDITDDGKGIPPEALTSRRSLGLLSIRERAALLRGTTEFRRQSPTGTRVIVRVPESQAPS